MGAFIVGSDQRIKEHDDSVEGHTHQGSQQRHKLVKDGSVGERHIGDASSTIAQSNESSQVDNGVKGVSLPLVQNSSEQETGTGSESMSLTNMLVLISDISSNHVIEENVKDNEGRADNFDEPSLTLVGQQGGWVQHQLQKSTKYHLRTGNQEFGQSNNPKRE